MKDKDEFKARFVRRPVEVEIQGRKALILPLSRADCREIVAMADHGQAVLLTIAKSLCDANGQRLFQDGETEEIAGFLSRTDHEAIYREVTRINGLGDNGGKAPSPEETTS